jgi:DNA-binding transcriptional LysR family regulator
LARYRVQRIDTIPLIGFFDGCLDDVGGVMLDLRQLRAFSAVVREGSFTRAAGVLHYAQSSVTAQVQALEQQLGVPLLDRLPGRVELTSAGEVLLTYSERLLALAEEACESVHSDREPAGTLTLSAAESVLTYRLPRLLRAFQDRYAKVKIELHAPGMSEFGPPIGLGVDIAISINERIQEPHLEVELLRAEPVRAVVARDHPLAGKSKVSAQEIVAEQLLLTEHSCSYRALFERSLAVAGARPTRTLEFASVEAIKQCARARMGVAVLPEMVVAGDLRSGELVALPWPRAGLNVYTQLVRRKDKWVSPAMQAFWQMAVQTVREDEAGPTPRSGRGAGTRDCLPCP